MKRNNIVICFCVLMCCFSCQSGSKTENFKPIKNDIKINAYNELFTHEVLLDSIESSYIGDLFIVKDSIYFIDKRFCWVFVFDKNGIFKNRYLGQGRGPSEISTGLIDGYLHLNDDSHFFIGGSNDCHFFDKDFRHKKSFIIDKGNKSGSLDYDSPAIYTLNYSNLIIKNYEDYLYYTIYSEYGTMNFIESPLDYFKKSRMISKLNIKTGRVEKVLGNFPDIYCRDLSLKQLSNLNFDIDNDGSFYLSFEADSLIYVFDKDFYPVSTFGYSGKEMIHKPLVLSSFESFQNEYEQNRAERGFYTSIDYIDETGLLLRTYQKGSEQKMDGLQIYKSNTMIGDANVPKGFKILGYIEPYYYGFTKIDEDNETIKIYKFEI
jgi:hypothetical protein